MNIPSRADKRGRVWPEGSLHPNDYFSRIVCLNLDRRADRWERMAQEFRLLDLDVERVPAIDGQQTAVREEYESTRLWGCGLSCAEYACLQSYRRIFTWAQSENWERLLIIEDDACFHNDFPGWFQHVREVPSNWRLLYLGCSQHNWQHHQTTSAPIYPARRSLGTFAFAASRRAYSEIIRRLQGSTRAVDECLAAVQHRHRQACWVFSPNLVIAAVDDSDIRQPRSLVRHAEQMRWDLSLYRLPHAKAAPSSSHFVGTEGR